MINLDFADVRNIMKDKGTAMIGMGKGTGESKARDEEGMITFVMFSRNPSHILLWAIDVSLTRK